VRRAIEDIDVVELFHDAMMQIFRHLGRTIMVFMLTGEDGRQIEGVSRSFSSDGFRAASSIITPMKSAVPHVSTPARSRSRR
jgi:hypothetical protein